MKRTKQTGMDMVSGSMWDKILLFALPLAAGSMLQQLFNSVDAAVVGRFASSEALAAVGANTSVVSLFINLFVGISVGSNVVIANNIGKGKRERIPDVVHTTMLLAIVSGLLLLVAGMCVARPLLQLLSTPENVLDLAVVYLRLYCLGMPFIMTYNFAAAILRSKGDTKRPLYCLILSGCINAGLNILFVVGFHLSVAGVALATVIANVVSCSMAVYFLMHEEAEIRLHWNKLAIHREELWTILRIGIPAGVQGIVFSFSNVCIQAAVNTFGSAAVAGSAISMNFEYITCFAFMGFNSAAVTFTSQNYGAGKAERCKRVCRICMLCGVCVCLALDVFFYLGRGLWIGFFTTDAATAACAAQRMQIVLLFQCLACSYEISGSALRGYGHSLVPALLTVFGTCIFRVIWVNTVVPAHHTLPVLFSIYPISWIVTGMMVLTAYFFVSRKVLRKLPRT